MLDEATSSLDPLSEETVQRTLASLRGEKTIIVIAHRLSTILRADRIVVLAKGRVAEQGSHEELLRAKGLYWQLWHAQYAAPALV